MKKIFRVSFLIFSFYLLASCITSEKEKSKIDCRNIVDDVVVQREIHADLKERFPNYKEIYISSVGLTLHAEGIRYYPVSVRTKENRIYTVIYNYSPENELCKKLSYQYIQLEPRP